jgi:hypothetical protein
MKTLAFLAAIAVSGIAFAEEPELVKVYCFSADLEAGFKDKITTWFCEMLEKRGKKKGSLLLVDKGNAEIAVEYLATDKKTTNSGTVLYSGGIAVAGQRTVSTSAINIVVGDFEKAFDGKHPSDSANEIESWIRENRKTILQKARKK